MAEAGLTHEKLLQLAEIEANTDITIGAWRMPNYHLPIAKTSVLSVAFAKLMQLRRRSLGLLPADLARELQVPLNHVLAAETGNLSPIFMKQLDQLATVLKLPAQALRELTTVEPARTTLATEADRFVAQTSEAAPLTPTESQALADFVQTLTTEL